VAFKAFFPQSYKTYMFFLLGRRMAKKVYNENIMNETKKTIAEIQHIEDELLSNKSYETLTDFYSIFADKTRLILISLLSRHELCVNDIAEILGMSQSRISHQLAILRKHDIVTTYREGKSVIYALTDNHIKDLFHTGLEHVSEKDEDLYKDRRKKGL
jgi:ArsR family transcriptional regulator